MRFFWLTQWSPRLALAMVVILPIVGCLLGAQFGPQWTAHPWVQVPAPPQKPTKLLGVWHGPILITELADVYLCPDFGDRTCKQMKLPRSPDFQFAGSGDSTNLYFTASTGTYACNSKTTECRKTNLPRPPEHPVPCDTRVLPLQPTPGEVLEHLEVMACGPDGYVQLDYIILKDGTLWETSNWAGTMMPPPGWIYGTLLAIAGLALGGVLYLGAAFCAQRARRA